MHLLLTIANGMKRIATLPCAQAARLAQPSGTQC